MLVRHLPREAALYRDLDADVAPWGLAEQLLAGIADLLAVGNWQRVVINSGKRQRPPAPRPLPRPGVAADPDHSTIRGTPMTIAELRERLGRSEAG